MALPPLRGSVLGFQRSHCVLLTVLKHYLRTIVFMTNFVMWFLEYLSLLCHLVILDFWMNDSDMITNVGCLWYGIKSNVSDKLLDGEISCWNFWKVLWKVSEGFSNPWKFQSCLELFVSGHSPGRVVVEELKFQNDKMPKWQNFWTTLSIYKLFFVLD